MTKAQFLDQLLEWLKLSPPGATLLITSLLGGAVAILTVILTQWILGRRARIELLSKKLEELSLLIIEAEKKITKAYDTLEIAVAQHMANTSPEKLFDYESYAPDHDPKIIVHVELYFPLLRTSNQKVKLLRDSLVPSVLGLVTGNHNNLQFLTRKYLRYREGLRHLFREAIENRKLLVGQHLVVWPGRYEREQEIQRLLSNDASRSSGAPTACHAGQQAQNGAKPQRWMASVTCRRRPLSSNVRPHRTRSVTIPP